MGPTFQPFKMELTFSTLDQARAFYAIFNHTNNTQLLPDHNEITHKLYEHVGPKVYEAGRGSIIANGVLYDEFYR